MLTRVNFPQHVSNLNHWLTTQSTEYLNVRQRKLGTIIIQTVHIVQHEIAVACSLPEGDLCNVHGHSNLFPKNLALHCYGYTSVPMEVAEFSDPGPTCQDRICNLSVL